MGGSRSLPFKSQESEQAEKPQPEWPAVELLCQAPEVMPGVQPSTWPPEQAGLPGHTGHATEALRPWGCGSLPALPGSVSACVSGDPTLLSLGVPRLWCDCPPGDCRGGSALTERVGGVGNAGLFPLCLLHVPWIWVNDEGMAVVEEHSVIGRAVCVRPRCTQVGEKQPLHQPDACATQVSARWASGASPSSSVCLAAQPQAEVRVLIVLRAPSGAVGMVDGTVGPPWPRGVGDEGGPWVFCERLRLYSVECWTPSLPFISYVSIRVVFSYKCDR